MLSCSNLTHINKHCSNYSFVKVRRCSNVTSLDLSLPPELSLAMRQRLAISSSLLLLSNLSLSLHVATMTFLSPLLDLNLVLSFFSFDVWTILDHVTLNSIAITSVLVSIIFSGKVTLRISFILS